MKTYRVGLRGESNYQATILRCKVGDQVNLRPEPDNPYDRRAVRAMAVGRGLVGYLPKDGWLTAVMLDEDRLVRARIESIAAGPSGLSGVVIEVLID